MNSIKKLLVSCMAVLLIAAAVFSPATADAAAIEAPKSKTPNIYCLLFDEFASIETIKDIYGYDSDFGEFLTSVGFSVSKSSYTATTSTYKTMINLYNLQYLVDESYSEAKAIKEHKTSGVLFSLLQQLGYDTYQCSYSDDHMPLDDLLDKDVYASATGQYMKDGLLVKDIIKNGLLLTPFTNFDAGSAITVAEDADEAALADNPRILHWKAPWVNQVFDYYENDDNYVFPNSTAIFTYQLGGHVPFMFAADGTAIPIADKSDWVHKSVYLGQWRYMATRLKTTIKHILANDPDSIILIYCDHGPRNHARWMQNNNPYKIFNALYYRGEQVDIEGMSSLNAWRYVLTRLGLDYPQVDDPAYLYFTNQSDTFVLDKQWNYDR